MTPNPRRYHVTIRFDGLNWQAEKWAGRTCVDMTYLVGDRDDLDLAASNAFDHFGLIPYVDGEPIVPDAANRQLSIF